MSSLADEGRLAQAKSDIKESVFELSKLYPGHLNTEDKMIFVFCEIFIPLYKDFMLEIFDNARTLEGAKKAIEQCREGWINEIKEL